MSNSPYGHYPSQLFSRNGLAGDEEGRVNQIHRESINNIPRNDGQSRFVPPPTTNLFSPPPNNSPPEVLPDEEFSVYNSAPTIN
mmetsp:Transcript_25561/g.24856  ORF Transcript_25561/g.24856 Transcript_25561/m.24856 type:complete len:84 (+) Transcript_25561:266-517(+)